MSQPEVADAKTHTTLRGRRLAVGRALWVVIAVLAVGLYIAALPYDFQELQRICSGTDCRVDVQLTQPDAVALEDLGLSLGFYAGFFLSIEVLILVVFAVMAGLIFWRRSDDWMALFLSLALLLEGLILPAIMEQVQEQVPALELVIDFLSHLGLVAIIILFFVFPDGRFVPRWTRFFAIGVALLTLVSFTAFVVPQGGGMAPGGNPLKDGLVALIALALPVGVFAQIYRYRRVSDPVTRQQVKWVVLALTAAVLGATVGLSAGALVGPGRAYVLFNLVGVPLLFALPYLMVPVAIAVSVLRYRLWEIDIIVNRTLVYATLTVILAGVYVGSVVGLQAAFRAVTGQSSDLAIVISTLAIAALFVPVRGSVQRIIDRRFYRRRYDAARTLAAFADRMRDEVDVDRVTRELVGVVHETMQPAHASLWLRNPSRGHPAGSPAAE